MNKFLLPLCIIHCALCISTSAFADVAECK